MKRLFLLCLFMVTLTTKFQAQEQGQDNPEFKAEAIEFIKLTGAAKAFEDAIDQIGAIVPSGKKEAYKTEAMGTLAEIYDKMAELYMGEFTRDEIQEIVKFFKTDIGKKLAGKQMSLAQKGMMMGQNWGMKVQEIAQKHQ